MLANADLSSGVGDHLVAVAGGEAPIAAIPTAALQSHDAFRDWATSPSFPEQVVVTYLNGEVCIDMSPDNLDTHNLLKGKVFRVLDELVERKDLGVLFADGCLLSNAFAKLTTVPDALFASHESLESELVRPTASKAQPGSHVELNGSPDWVLEVVSASSVHKDNQTLRDGYYRAGVKEYWIIDGRDEDLSFAMLVRGPNSFIPVAPEGGFLSSPTFNARFALTRRRDRHGFWQYSLSTQ